MRAFEQRKKNNPDNSSFFGPKIQKKLKTGTAGDRFETEADHVADKVVNKNASGGGLLQSKEEVQQKPISASITAVQAKDMKKEEPVQKKGKEEEAVQKKGKEEEKPVQKKGKEEEKPVQKKGKEEEKPVQKKEEKEEPIQAKCADCEKEDKVQKKDKKEEEKPVQKKEKNSESEVHDTELEGKLHDSKGSGTGMDKKTKKEMESGFGNDFSNVKIHTDARAVQMSQELGAQAFTNGNDVYFNDGKYNPHSKEGKHLLAHELTHTVQQTGMVQKSVDPDASEDLEAARFQGDSKLEQTHDNLDYLATGAKGGPVQKVQSGLMDLSYTLPKFGADGDFGSETKAAVLDFQSSNGLTYDGVVGVQTIGRLDDIHAGKGKGKGKGKKPPQKKSCGKQIPFHFSSEPVHIETLVSSAECKTFTIILNTVKKKTENSCPTYNVDITDSSGAAAMSQAKLSVGGTATLSFTAPKPDTYSLVISTAQTCGEDAFSGTGTKQRK
ncbi:DUF4157 domain-containing protein [Flavobacterium sp. GA093]|uniref:DUF4157 domain-containing protein n=1 Tax=Flavobacterium hydrocarbonoxydans TaxID=2683249 RepID=A0A6I4NJG2_9FLAO|nr:DUF4157 domain-containing protein [Flavobacterium hydrocarbonoxydans]MWB94636.1 DUF4157 domain-containing protein [Flavobacterium hydrocarbonoxydans]